MPSGSTGLFQILKQSAQSLNLGNPHRTGAGLPDAPRGSQCGTGGSDIPSAEIMQRLVELLQSGAVPQGNGGAAVGAGMALPQLRAMLERAGLLPGGGTGVAPQSSAPGISAGGATAPMPQLRAVLERAACCPEAVLGWRRRAARPGSPRAEPLRLCHSSGRCWSAPACCNVMAHPSCR